MHKKQTSEKLKLFKYAVFAAVYKHQHQSNVNSMGVVDAISAEDYRVKKFFPPQDTNLANSLQRINWCFISRSNVLKVLSHRCVVLR